MRPDHRPDITLARLRTPEPGDPMRRDIHGQERPVQPNEKWYGVQVNDQVVYTTPIRAYAEGVVEYLRQVAG